MNERSENMVRATEEKADIHTDFDLIERWLANRRIAKRGGNYLWVDVMETFGVGSTSAHQICRRHDMDPDLMVRQS